MFKLTLSAAECCWNFCVLEQHVSLWWVMRPVCCNLGFKKFTARLSMLLDLCLSVWCSTPFIYIVLFILASSEILLKLSVHRDLKYRWSMQHSWFSVRYLGKDGIL